MIEILRPNTPGDYTNINRQWPDEGEHWDKVVVADGGDTRVFTMSTPQQKDAYNLTPSAIPVGSTINSVKVYGTFLGGYYQPFLRLGTDETAGTKIEGAADYETHYETLSRPGGGVWSVADLADLQVVIGLHRNSTYCHFDQVYVEVDYTPPPPTIFEQMLPFISGIMLLGLVAIVVKGMFKK